MSLLLTATLFASLATAQLTTSIWMPGAPNANQSFVGSVVTQQGDRTTLSIAFDEAVETEYYGTAPGLVTLGATTYVAYAATASGSSEDNAVTAYLECSRADGKAVPTCAMTTRGGGPKASTASLDDDDFPETTMTMSGDSQYMMNTYKLVITAGTDKLKASAAATPTSGSGSSTAGGSTAGGSTAARSTAGSSGVAQATGAAAPMLAIAPALAGLGAAAAFFV